MIHYHDVLSSMGKLDAKTIRKQLGETVRTHRVAMNVSQEKLAELLDVHRNYVGKIERGEQNITINSLCRFSELFHCKLSTLLSESGL